MEHLISNPNYLKAKTLEEAFFVSAYIAAKCETDTRLKSFLNVNVPMGLVPTLKALADKGFELGKSEKPYEKGELIYIEFDLGQGVMSASVARDDIEVGDSYAILNPERGLLYHTTKANRYVKRVAKSIDYCGKPCHVLPMHDKDWKGGRIDGCIQDLVLRCID